MKIADKRSKAHITVMNKWSLSRENLFSVTPTGESAKVL
jgi:hypothetical protein